MLDSAQMLPGTSQITFVFNTRVNWRLHLHCSTTYEALRTFSNIQDQRFSTAFCFLFFVSTERKPEQNSNGRHFFLCSLKYFTDYKLNCQSPADTVTLVLKLLSKIYDTISRLHVLFLPIEDTGDCRFDVNDACVYMPTYMHTK